MKTLAKSLQGPGLSLRELLDVGKRTPAPILPDMPPTLYFIYKDI